MHTVLVDQTDHLLNKGVKGVIPISGFGFERERTKTIIPLSGDLDMLPAATERDLQEKLTQTFSQTGNSFKPGVKLFFMDGF